MPAGLLLILETNTFLVLLQPVNQVAPKAASFSWGPEDDRALQQVQAAVQAALPLAGSRRPRGACSAGGRQRCCLEVLAGSVVELKCRPLGF